MSVTIYSTGPDCMQCKLTERLLDELEIAYTIIDLRRDDAALEYVTEDLGYSQAPIVCVDGEPENHWSGFQDDQIKRLAQAVAS
ncbi:MULTISPECIES: glutaredoxin domain-containing protein [Microbacterium]|uniref:glutaredoxin domain-containing protein n=1 Tax=Microbacterium TaxID=33882 RepID=UPI00146D6AF9|nr:MULTISPECIES: glutaredoxin domain-containing protein [Microbacterium]